MHVELTALTKPLVEGVSPEDFAAYIARIGKVKQNPDRLLKYLIAHAHWSPFEHTFVTFKITTSRAMGRELLRHRSFTFQELSQRYEKVLANEPVELRSQCARNRQSSTDVCNPELTLPGRTETVHAQECISDLLNQINTLYHALLEAGVARECARFILPECTQTTILMTGSVRSWIHFFAIRDHENAQREMQEIARAAKKIFIEQFPAISEAAFTKSESFAPATPCFTTENEKRLEKTN